MLYLHVYCILFFCKNCISPFLYMLCAKFGSGQSSDCPAQTSDPSFAQQSSDCPRNPRIAPNEVRKVWMKGNPRIARVTLSSYCRQVIRRSKMYCSKNLRRSRTYCTQETSLNVDVQRKVEQQIGRSFVHFSNASRCAILQRAAQRW